MAMIKRKKLKLKVLPTIILISIILIVGILIYSLFYIPIKNIIIKGNNYLNDDYILEITNLKNYPSIMKYSNKTLEKKLKKSIYIKEAKIKKDFYHIVKIQIKENKPLFIYRTNNSIVFEDNRQESKDKITTYFSLPTLINETPNDKLNILTSCMKKTKKTILNNISEIKYEPVKLDEDRFLLLMNDKNEIYITLTKCNKLNYYNEILKQLENKHGILYLDSGNYFEIKE